MMLFIEVRPGTPSRNLPTSHTTQDDDLQSSRYPASLHSDNLTTTTMAIKPITGVCTMSIGTFKTSTDPLQMLRRGLVLDLSVAFG